MPLKHITYLSTAKLKLYHPQIPPRFLAGASAKVKFNVGVFSAEVGANPTESSNEIIHLQELLAYLQSEKLVGAEIEAKPFVKGTMSASALLDGPRVFFSGTIDQPTECISACLCASAKHIGGYDPKIEDDATKTMTEIGGVEAAIFHLNSNTVAFGDRLIEVSAVTRKLAEAPMPITRNFGATDFLGEDDRTSYDRCRFLNPLIKTLYPSNPFELDLRYWRRELVSTLLLGPFLFLLLGPGGVGRKRRAIAKLRHSKTYEVASNELSEQEQRILEAACIIASGGRASSQKYEFVARRLLQGISHGGKKVLLASPLYMATEERYG